MEKYFFVGGFSDICLFDTGYRGKGGSVDVVGNRVGLT